MKDTLPHSIQVSIRNLVGTPYKVMNCWDVVRYSYKEWFGIDLKKYYTRKYVRDVESSELIESNIGSFKEVGIEHIDFGDIVLLKWNNLASHIGVYLGNNLLLHSTESKGCVIERLSFWENRVVGFYRTK